jgi:MFS family permease
LAARNQYHLKNGGAIHSGEESYAMESITRTRSNMGDALESLYQTQTTRSQVQTGIDPELAEVGGSSPSSRGRPQELSSLSTELVFVLVCSSGQLFFSFFQGNVNVNQQAFRLALGIQNTELPWMVGSYLVALGLSVILSGSLSDLMPPRLVVVAAFVWLTIWNIIGVFSLTPSRSTLFFFMRAMQGLSVGVIVSGSMSILGRVYAPGLRKTRVFSAMAAMAPFGFWLGAIQGGALTAHLEWIFGSNAILCALCAIAAYFTIPPLRPVADIAGSDAPTIRDFDWKGAILATSGCVCLLFGLTQGTVAHWSPYTYILIIVGAVLLAAFFVVEHKVHRPLIPNTLWKTPGFAPLMAAYFLGFGGFVGAWQFYAMQFFLNVQNKSALTVALYLLPNALMGVLATFIVAKLLHRIPGHYIYMVSMIAFALGPAFFLGNRPSTTYWALSMPGIALATFGPDMSFAAASIFITSNVPRSYQGSAGSLLVTIQNLSSAIMTSVGDSIAAEIDTLPDGTIGMEGLRAAWWFALAAALAGALITAVAVRIPKEVEKEHVT